MNRFRRLHTAIVLLILAIMSISCIVPGCVLVILKMLGFFEGYLHWTPIVLAGVMFLISLILGTVLAFFVTKRFLRPINHLIVANKRVADGDFTVRVEETSVQDGEVQELLHSFNLMVSELQSIELYRSDFINNFSHEFKTPIISVRGFARQLKNPNLSQQQRNEYLDIIIKESEKLCNMSTNVLQISRLENQSFISDITTVSLDEQIRNAILLLERHWQEKQIQWDLDLQEVNYACNADLLSQVWSNLLENAIKFVDTEGIIQIVLRENEQSVSVMIADNGCGIAEESLPRIFEKFYQGDPSHKHKGNGLGLSIVKRIVELCGGTVTVTSKIKKGTTFTVNLPKSNS